VLGYPIPMRAAKIRPELFLKFAAQFSSFLKPTTHTFGHHFSKRRAYAVETLLEE
jgi:hypothetical protein